MILHATDKFLKTFRCPDSRHWDKMPMPFISWHAHIFLVGKFGRFVIFSESHTLFTFLIPLRGSRSLAAVKEGFHRETGRFLKSANIWNLPGTGEWTLVSRHLQGGSGCVEELIRRAKSVLQDQAPPLTDALLQRMQATMNERTFKPLDSKCPREAADEVTKWWRELAPGDRNALRDGSADPAEIYPPVCALRTRYTRQTPVRPPRLQPPYDPKKEACKNVLYKLHSLTPEQRQRVIERAQELNAKSATEADKAAQAES